jgi:hypothetical protein
MWYLGVYLDSSGRKLDNPTFNLGARCWHPYLQPDATCPTWKTESRDQILHCRRIPLPHMQHLLHFGDHGTVLVFDFH